MLPVPRIFRAINVLWGGGGRDGGFAYVSESANSVSMRSPEPRSGRLAESLAQPGKARLLLSCGGVGATPLAAPLAGERVMMLCSSGTSPSLKEAASYLNELSLLNYLHWCAIRLCCCRISQICHFKGPQVKSLFLGVVIARLCVFSSGFLGTCRNASFCRALVKGPA